MWLHLLGEDKVQVQQGVLQAKAGVGGSVETDEAARHRHGHLVGDDGGDSLADLDILRGQDEMGLHITQEAIQVVQVVLVGLGQVIESGLEVLLLAQPET